VIVEQKRQGWLFAGVAISVLLLMVLVLYQHTLVYLIGLWNRLHAGEYGHGYLVLAISVFLIARERRGLLAITPCPSYTALAAVIASSLLWLVASLVDVNMMEAVALLLLVVSLVWVVLGDGAIRVLIFPLFFIGFAIPIWFPLSPLLQDLTANAVFWVVRLLEVPAFRQENMIIVPAGTLSVEEACSGLRYLLAALTLGTLYAYLNFHTLRSRLLVVLISAAVAVLANIIRVFIVVYLGYITEMQHPFVNDHLMLGWYLFGGLVVILLFTDARLYKYYRPVVVDGAIKHGSLQSESCNKDKWQYGIIVIITIALISVAPALVYQINNQEPVSNQQVNLVLPGGAGGWSAYNATNDDWMPVFNGAINHKQGYRKDNSYVTLYLGYYPEQVQGKELINDLNKISDQKEWRSRYTRARPVRLQDDNVLEQWLENSDGSQRLVWYWYYVAGRTTTSEYTAKLLQVFGMLTGEWRASLIAVAIDVNGTADDARRMLEDFIIENDPTGLMDSHSEA